MRRAWSPGATAHLQAKPHDTPASFYTVGYLELASMADLVDAITDEARVDRVR